MEENKMGVMPIGKLIVTMSLPIMISMLVQALYNVVDSVFVARIDEYALTAVSMAFPIQNLMIAVSVGTAVGVNALLARYLGAKDYEKVNKIAENAVFLAIMSYLVFLLIGLFLAEPFYRSQTDIEEIVQYGRQYISICCCLSFGVFIQIMFERLLQATGKTVYTMCTQGVGALTNIILDPILIFGMFGLPRMGVAGAAAATVAGQMVAAVLAVSLNHLKNKEVRIQMKGFCPNPEIIGQIYEIGLPAIVMQAIGSAMNYGMNRILITFSSTATAVFGVYFKLQSFVFMPVFGLNQGALPVMGYNYGARNRKRLMGAYKITLTAAVVSMALGLVLFQLLPEPMLMLFVDKSDAAAAQEMIEVGVPALKTISLSFLGAAFGIINSTMFQATARGMNSLIVSVCRQLVVILPAAWLLGQQFGLNAVWYAFPIAEIAAFFISYILLWREYRSELRFLDVEKEAKA